jgi:hypothetical protein
MVFGLTTKVIIFFIFVVVNYGYNGLGNEEWSLKMKK